MITVIFTIFSTVMFSIQMKATRKELTMVLTVITIIIMPSQALAAYCVAKIWNKGAEQYDNNDQYVEHVVLPAVFSTTATYMILIGIAMTCLQSKKKGLSSPSLRQPPSGLSLIHI